MSLEFDYPRDFKGIFIPKEIWLDDDLSAIDKIILAEIYSLDVEDGDGCHLMMQDKLQLAVHGLYRRI